MAKRGLAREKRREKTEIEVGLPLLIDLWRLTGKSMLLRWLLWLVFLPIALPLHALRAAFGRRSRPTVLELQLQGPVVDLSPTGGLVMSEPVTALLPLLSALKLAETDGGIRTLLVHIREFQPGLARAEELRAALARVAAAGKRVVVLAEELSLRSYWVALGASEIVLAPTGSLNLSGVASEFTLLRGLLDKAGIEAQLQARGEYKSAREVFTERELSEANREMLTALVGDLSQQLLARVAQARGLSSEEANHAVEAGPFRASQALQQRLVDKLAYPDEIVQPLKDAKHERFIRAHRYLKRRQRRWYPTRPVKIGLLRVTGSIKTGSDSPGSHGPRATGARSFVKAVERAAEAKDVKAIVLRVDSPGGSALASDLMWHALSRAREKKPVFVSMADVAASGGYYVSGLSGVKIWASPSTITGSIGVVAGKFAISGLLHKLGIKSESIVSHPHAAFFSAAHPWGEAELKRLSEEVDAFYEDFVEKMARGRGQTFEQLDQVARGRVWTGSQARERGLVDEEGGFREVLNSVRQQLRLKEDSPLALVDFNRQTLLQTLKARIRPSAKASLAAGLPAPVRSAIERAEDLGQARTFYMLPYELDLR